MEIKNKPSKIFLNLDIEDCGEDMIDFNDLCEVTWSAEKINADDIEYVIKQDVDWEARRYELVKTAMSSILSDPECEITPDELAESSVKVADAIIEKMKGGEK